MKKVISTNVYKGFVRFPLSIFHAIPWKIIVEKSVVRFPLSISTWHTLKCVCARGKSWKLGKVERDANLRAAGRHQGMAENRALASGWMMPFLALRSELWTAKEIGKRADDVFGWGGPPARVSRSRGRALSRAGQIG